MKKLVVFMLVACLLSACGSSGTGSGVTKKCKKHHACKTVSSLF